MFSTLYSQSVYNKDASNKSIIFDKINIDFVKPTELNNIKDESKAAGAVIASIVPNLIDLGFKVTSDVLKKRAKKFSGEYVIEKSYLHADTGVIPEISFKRKIKLKGAVGLESALTVDFGVIYADNVGGFMFIIKSIVLNYSKAKVTGNSKRLDYIFEIKPTFYYNGKKTKVELYPIRINSVEFKRNVFEKNSYRSDIIFIPKDAFLTEFSVKIIEVNPKKVNADEILSVFDNYSEDSKTIIKNIIVATQSSQD